jgi:hypothetical protein
MSEPVGPTGTAIGKTTDTGITPGFSDRLQVEQVDACHWRLLRSFSYNSAVAKARIIVPNGFVTDFASVPRLPLVFLVVGDMAQAAAVIHDWLYTTGVFPKAIADAVFYEAMRASGIDFFHAKLMYWGVAYGGGTAWAKHRSEIPNLFTATTTVNTRSEV